MIHCMWPCRRGGKRLPLLLGAGAIAFAVGLGGAQSPADAQDYPSKPVEMIVGLGAGGGVDTAARALAAALGPFLNGQPAIVVNKPGGAQVPAMKLVAQSTPDGHTLMVLSGGAILAQLFRDRGVDVFTDLVPIAQITDNALGIFTLRESGWDTPQKLVTAIKEAHSQGRKLRWGHSGRGAMSHVAAAAWLIENDVYEMVQDVPFQGGSGARTALLGKQVDFGSAGLTNLTGFEADLAILGIYSEERDPTRPDVPTLIEQGSPTVPMSPPVIIMGPKGMLEGRVRVMAEAIRQATASETFRNTTSKSGQPAIYLGPEASAKLLRDRRERWSPAVEFIKKKMEGQ
ncbi:MAG: tripartite tricarboxylate transporter substrate binding protein [Acetobacterales bacterium]